MIPQSFGLSSGKSGRPQGNSPNLPFPPSIYHYILANEDTPLLPTPLWRRFLISSTSHFVKAASLRRWLVSDLLAWQSTTIGGSPDRHFDAAYHLART